MTGRDGRLPRRHNRSARVLLSSIRDGSRVVHPRRRGDAGLASRRRARLVFRGLRALGPGVPGGGARARCVEPDGCDLQPLGVGDAGFPGARVRGDAAPGVARVDRAPSPLPAPPHVAAGGVDPWGIFASPGSRERWAGARAPPHLFPQGFTPSRWVSPQVPGPPPPRYRATLPPRRPRRRARRLPAPRRARAPRARRRIRRTRGSGLDRRSNRGRSRRDTAPRSAPSHPHTTPPRKSATRTSRTRATTRAWRVKRAVAPAFGRGAAVAAFAVAPRLSSPSRRRLAKHSRLTEQ